MTPSSILVSAVVNGLLKIVTVYAEHYKRNDVVALIDQDFVNLIISFSILSVIDLNIASAFLKYNML